MDTFRRGRVKTDTGNRLLPSRYSNLIFGTLGSAFRPTVHPSTTFTQQIRPSEGDVPLVLDRPFVAVKYIQNSVTLLSQRQSVVRVEGVNVINALMAGGQTLRTIQQRVQVAVVKTSNLDTGRTKKHQLACPK